MEANVSKIWTLQPPRRKRSGPEPDASLDAAQPGGAFQQILLNTGGQGGVGAILKAKHFRIHAVTDQTILFN